MGSGGAAVKLEGLKSAAVKGEELPHERCGTPVRAAPACGPRPRSAGLARVRRVHFILIPPGSQRAGSVPAGRPERQALRAGRAARVLACRPPCIPLDVHALSSRALRGCPQAGAPGPAQAASRPAQDGAPAAPAGPAAAGGSGGGGADAAAEQRRREDALVAAAQARAPLPAQAACVPGAPAALGARPPCMRASRADWVAVRPRLSSCGVELRLGHDGCCGGVCASCRSCACAVVRRAQRPAVSKIAGVACAAPSWRRVLAAWRDSRRWAAPGAGCQGDARAAVAGLRAPAAGARAGRRALGPAAPGGALAAAGLCAGAPHAAPGRQARRAGRRPRAVAAAAWACRGCGAGVVALWRQSATRAALHTLRAHAWLAEPVAGCVGGSDDEPPPCAGPVRPCTWAGWPVAACWLLEGTSAQPGATHTQERLWKRAAAKALADAAAAAALRGGLRAAPVAADVRGGAAAAKARTMTAMSRTGRHTCTALECALAQQTPTVSDLGAAGFARAPNARQPGTCAVPCSGPPVARADACGATFYPSPTRDKQLSCPRPRRRRGRPRRRSAARAAVRPGRPARARRRRRPGRRLAAPHQPP